MLIFQDPYWCPLPCCEILYRLGCFSRGKLWRMLCPERFRYPSWRRHWPSRSTLLLTLLDHLCTLRYTATAACLPETITVSAIVLLFRRSWLLHLLVQPGTFRQFSFFIVQPTWHLVDGPVGSVHGDFYIFIQVHRYHIVPRATELILFPRAVCMKLLMLSVRWTLHLISCICEVRQLFFLNRFKIPRIYLLS